MTDRTCGKCNGDLLVNKKLGLMECDNGHYNLINTRRAQWWNMCPKCKQIGVNDIDGEARLMRVVKGKVVTHTVEGKDEMPVFDIQIATPIKCRACGNVFTKK